MDGGWGRGGFCIGLVRTDIWPSVYCVELYSSSSAGGSRSVRRRRRFRRQIQKPFKADVRPLVRVYDDNLTPPPPTPLQKGAE